MMHTISLQDTVYDVIKTYPEVREILIDLGFTPLRDDAMLHTAGRMMTIGRAAKQFGLSYETIDHAMKIHGFQLKETEL